MKWPEYFPQDCPPDDAREASDRVYRFIEQDRPTPEDFLTVRELYPTRKFPETEKECRACAMFCVCLKRGSQTYPKIW